MTTTETTGDIYLLVQEEGRIHVHVIPPDSRDKSIFRSWSITELDAALAFVRDRLLNPACQCAEVPMAKRNGQ